jgi:N-acetylmuramoyl-L-alanine amidase
MLTVLGETPLINFRKTFVIFYVFLFTSLFFNFNCFAADTGTFEDITPMTSNVSINKVWHIKFNMDLNKNTVNSNNIMVLDEKQQAVAVNVSCGEDNRSVTVTPVNSYNSGKTYSLIVTKNVQAISGKNIEIPKRMKFSTVSQSDSTFKVCIDAGYGGSDGGQIGQAGGKESSVNLSVALKIGKILEAKDIQVIYTRTSDVNVDSEARFKIANDNNVNYFISIHCNASKEKSASGIETYYLDGNSAGKELASLIQTQLIKSTGSANRGAKPGQYTEVKSTNAPGVKIYLGFMTTSSEEKLLCSEDFQNKSAAAIASGIAANFSQVSNSTSTSSDLPASTGSIGGVTTKANDIITYAYNFLGIPYLVGGASPITGFDCSGFVQYVYAHFGIKLSRDTYSQIKQGKAVIKAQLMPGDLIFFGTIDNPNHVAIYVGNNLFIHAPRTGEVVKVSTLEVMTDYLCARRILN